MKTVLQLGKDAKLAAKKINTASTGIKNQILLAVSQKLRDNIETIVKANAADLQNAKTSGMRQSMIDRLTLTPVRIEAIAQAVEQVVQLADPAGVVESGVTRPNGLRIYKTRVPMGVVAMIYEARPNVTVDAAALCIKSGNACILRGGKEAIETNRTLVALIRQAIEGCDMPADIVCLVEDTSRESATQLMTLNGYVDVLIPRGGSGLIQSVVKNATVPCIETGVGNCHIFVDETADLQQSVAIVDNAKTQRPSVCNAVETLLVHKNIAGKFLPMVAEKLAEHHTQLRGCPATCKILGDGVIPATEEDYRTEFNDYILAVKVVENLQEAIDHIGTYSSGHSEAILTNDYGNSQKFLAQVDAAAVYVNASTRFTDGGEFGFGAEIGISTQKLHARGPMGLAELTTTKYVILGDGQIRG